MSLQVKTILIIGFIGTILLASFFFLSRAIILPRFEKVEEDRMALNVERVMEAFNREMDFLSLKLIDWSNWDDTYQFVKDRNQAYITSNLPVDTFINLKIDTIAFIDSTGAPVYEKQYDYVNKKETEGTNLQQYYPQIALFPSGQMGGEKKGFINTTSGILLFVSRPILTSLAEGPARGSILFAKHLTKDNVKELANITRVDIRFDEITSNMLTDIKTGVWFDKNADTIKAYTVLSDYFGSPGLLLTVSSSRDIYASGAMAIQYYEITAAIVAFLMLASIVILINQLVLRKIFIFTTAISQITQGKDLSDRIAYTGGNDELEKIRISVNTMLDALDVSQKNLNIEQVRSAAYLKIIGIMVVVLDRTGTVILVNEKAKGVLGAVKDADILGKNWFDTFVPETDRIKTKEVFDQIVQGSLTPVEFYENPVITLQGEERLISWHNAFYKDIAGEIIGSISSGEDITVKKKQENEATHHMEELKQLNDLMVGRELKMVELKSEIEQLKKKAGTT